MKASYLSGLFMLAFVAFSLAAEEHHHKAPHGGTLVALGDHFAHLEIVLDAKTGKITAYVLDGEAEKAVRIKQDELEIKAWLPKSAKDGAHHPHDGEAHLQEVKLKLKAVANVLTGEKKGDSSEFSAELDALKNAKKFDAEVQKIEIKGQRLKNVKFNFPKGNEGGHDEHKEHDHKHEKK